VHGGVDAERDGALQVDGAGLALGVVTDELDRISVGWVVLFVRRSDGLERDLQLLENRAPLW